jgi:hypothetical protein
MGSLRQAQRTTVHRLRPHKSNPYRRISTRLVSTTTLLLATPLHSPHSYSTDTKTLPDFLGTPPHTVVVHRVPRHSARWRHHIVRRADGRLELTSGHIEHEYERLRKNSVVSRWARDSSKQRTAGLQNRASPATLRCSMIPRLALSTNCNTIRSVHCARSQLCAHTL